MKLSIRHELRFSYTKPVFLEPTLVRLRPRDDFSQKLERFDLEVDPQPAGRSDELDLLGNSGSLLWFNEQCPSLTLKVRSQVETLLTNPFNYLVTDPQTLKLPARYNQENRLALNPYLYRHQPDKAVEDLAQSLLMESDDNTLNYLYHATDFISREFQHVSPRQRRGLGAGQDPAPKGRRLPGLGGFVHGHLPCVGAGRAFRERLQILARRAGSTRTARLGGSLFARSRLAGL